MREDLSTEGTTCMYSISYMYENWKAKAVLVSSQGEENFDLKHF